MFEDAFAPYRTLIVKGAILIVEGSLRFDEFIEGWRLTVKRAMDIDQWREQHAKRLLLKSPPMSMHACCKTSSVPCTLPRRALRSLCLLSQPVGTS